MSPTHPFAVGQDVDVEPPHHTKGSPAVHDDELIARARTWLAEDPDADTREELGKLIEAGDVAELAGRFSGTLQFGTAGLRGELGAGPMRMNRAVVIRAAAGLAAYLKMNGGPTAPSSSATTPGTSPPTSPATPPP